MSSQKIAIVTDSSAYIPKEVMAGLNIHVIPLWMIWDDEKFRDGVDIDPESFYKRLSNSKTIPTSSQPSAGEFIEFFKKVAENNDAIVAVLVSSKLSGTIASALAAQKDLPEIPIEIVDTYNVSMGLGFPVLAAAKAVEAGETVEEIVSIAEGVSKEMSFLFAVDTLEFLRKGGRIGGAKALLGTALRIKPILHFEDGRIEPLMQIRTKKKALKGLLDIAESRLDGRKMAEVAVIDIDADKEGGQVAKMVEKRFGMSKVIRAGVSPVVGTHAGPGAVGLIFYPEE